MCSNYRPVTQTDRLLTFFGVERDRHDPPPADVYPSGLAPMIVLSKPGEEVAGRSLALVEAIYRLVPDFIAKVEWARTTYNARSESVDSKRTFKKLWSAGQRCIIPAEILYEPKYDELTGKPTRWAIQQASGAPMGVAGIYDLVKHPDGREIFTMAMLTVNCDDHEFYKRFHAPGHEKRMPIILAPEDYGPYLKCPVGEVAQYFKQWHGPLEGVAAPLPSRVKAAVFGGMPRVDMPKSGDLF